MVRIGEAALNAVDITYNSAWLIIVLFTADQTLEIEPDVQQVKQTG